MAIFAKIFGKRGISLTNVRKMRKTCLSPNLKLLLKEFPRIGSRREGILPLYNCYRVIQPPCPC